MQRAKILSFVGLPFVLSAVMVGTPLLAQSADAVSPEASVADAPQRVAAANDPRQQDPLAHAQKRLGRLKAALQITPEQETQWSAFSTAVLQQMEQFKAAREAMKNPAASAPERIDRQIETMKQRLAGFEAMGQAAKDLYAALSPAQQQIADERLLNWPRKHAG
jgi:hypothetical protein